MEPGLKIKRMITKKKKKKRRRKKAEASVAAQCREHRPNNELKQVCKQTNGNSDPREDPNSELLPNIKRPDSTKC